MESLGLRVPSLTNGSMVVYGEMTNVNGLNINQHFTGASPETHFRRRKANYRYKLVHKITETIQVIWLKNMISSNVFEG